MNNSSGREKRRFMEEMKEQVGKKELRKLKARGEKDRGVWFGLGMFGLVGWSVAVPTLVFLAVGLWIDREWPSEYSWTLMLLFAGVVTGCLNAWFWVKKQSRGE